VAARNTMPNAQRMPAPHPCCGCEPFAQWPSPGALRPEDDLDALFGAASNSARGQFLGIFGFCIVWLPVKRALCADNGLIVGITQCNDALVDDDGGMNLSCLGKHFKCLHSIFRNVFDEGCVAVWYGHLLLVSTNARIIVEGARRVNGSNCQNHPNTLILEPNEGTRRAHENLDARMGIAPT
jgi:hypothetical protein